MTFTQNNNFLRTHAAIREEPNFEQKQKMIEVQIETNIRYFKPKFVKELEKFLKLQKIIKKNETRIRKKI